MNEQDPPEAAQALAQPQQPDSGTDLVVADPVALPRVTKPLSLTQSKIEALAAIVSQGNYLNVACRSIKLPYPTLMSWQTRGNKERATGVEAADSIYVELVEALEAAVADSEQRVVAVIMGAIDGISESATDVQRAKLGLEYLARKFPDRWSTYRDPAAGALAGVVAEVHIHLPAAPANQYRYLDLAGGKVIEGEYHDLNDEAVGQ